MLEQAECGAETLGDLFDLSARRIRQLADEKIVARVGHGRYMLAPSIRGYCKYLRTLGGGEAESLTRERVRVQRETADRLARENRVAAGELVPVGEMRLVLETCFSHARSRLLNLPSRAAALMVEMQSSADRQAILTNLVYEALDELAATSSEDIQGHAKELFGAAAAAEGEARQGEQDEGEDHAGS